jgi:succinate-semialdehyde dehydrogenase/glutarate-semialdehyde dehydrogenase
MATRGQMETVLEHLRDARDKGARVLAGGGRVEGRPGYFVQPTVLAGVDHGMKVMSEETFGPVLPIMPFADEDEAVALANDCDYGLTASVWTRSRKAAGRFADRLEAGTVTVNDHMFSFLEPKAIWGGIKQTGVGRSHGPYGMLHLVNVKFVSSEFRRASDLLWWFPYSPDKVSMLGHALHLMYGAGPGRKIKSAAALAPSLGTLLKTVAPKSQRTIAARLLRK